MSKYTTISALSAVALLALSACGGTTTATSDTSETASSSISASASSAPGLTIADAWIKASPNNMTGAFAKITNNTDEAVTIDGATSSASSRVELHTTEIDPTTGTSAMKLKEGGFTIEPGETYELVPGGDHIMLMDMTCSLIAGTTAVLTLETSAGTVEVDAPVRDYSGAQEEYAPGEEHSHGHSTMGDSHEGHDEAEHHHGGHNSDESDAVLPKCA